MEKNTEDAVVDKHGLVLPCGPVPQGGGAKEIAPGVWWIRMSLPFSLDHINLWAIRDGEGWALVDTGIWSTETAAAWRQLFATALPQGVTRVFVTHMHPDHIGMAGWLTRKFGCRLWISRLEYLSCRALGADTGREAPDDAIRFLQRAGWGEEAIETYRTRFGSFGKMVYALPDSYRRLRDGEEVAIGGQAWRVVVGSGHSPEHVCLYCPERKLFISGDQVLPGISSNVSVFPTEPDANPLADWLASLDKIEREVPDDVLVLPAHNQPFRGLHRRIAALRDSQHRALDRLREALQEPRRAVDVYGALFSRPVTADNMQMSLATGESLAHLNYLVARAEVTVTPGDDGCAWYQRAPG
ncbi:zinc metallohydrolase glyoxalase II family protein [Alicycliphilus denitrificans]|uniref:MBL fold metallo-hydrolase n=1 Tax=Alicycliphilus denitrificans TaxID=179636 RepID=UPI0009590515|nr:MBL fold metallo-hydrolase [Alicycliphilus denitrificans]OJW85168.1 MAG: MBL fold metallo-hydrolase [Alicycliphilus sp. 69-12]BCN39036.1 zinc metallohydrolase glyoxalase II family protein [Alicycliphilus denitrificans]